MNEPCPWCGAKSVDVTTFDDYRDGDLRKRYICCGATCHEWRDGVVNTREVAL